MMDFRVILEKFATLELHNIYWGYGTKNLTHMTKIVLRGLIYGTRTFFTKQTLLYMDRDCIPKMPPVAAN